jgi:hypothetical protein
MGNKYVIIKDMSAGNEFVGEMWKETKVFEGNETLDGVMAWAMEGGENRDKYPSRRNIIITKPHQEGD